MSRISMQRNESGQATAEFVIVMPLLLLILFAIVQFGITYNHYLELTDAVRAGARTASVSRTLSDPVGVTKTAVENAASDLNIPSSDITVTAPNGWDSGEPVQVSASYGYSFNILGIVVKSGTLTSTTTQRLE